MAHVIGKGWGYTYQSEILQHIQINHKGLITQKDRGNLKTILLKEYVWENTTWFCSSRHPRIDNAINQAPNTSKLACLNLVSTLSLESKRIDPSKFGQYTPAELATIMLFPKYLNLAADQCISSWVKILNDTYTIRTKLNDFIKECVENDSEEHFQIEFQKLFNQDSRAAFLEVVLEGVPKQGKSDKQIYRDYRKVAMFLSWNLYGIRLSDKVLLKPGFKNLAHHNLYYGNL